MSMFSKRHYVFIADVCRNHMIYPEDTDFSRSSESNLCIEVLANALAAENPVFNREKFMKAVYEPNK